MRTVLVPTVCSAALALGSLLAVVFGWPQLARFGVHGIAIIGLLFQFLALAGILMSLADDKRWSVDQKTWRFFRATGAIHLLMGLVALAVYGLRRGVKFVFEDALPDAFEPYGEYVFIALVIGIPALLFRTVPSLRTAVDRFRDWLDL